MRSRSIPAADGGSGSPRKESYIDAIVALCMAVERAEFQPEPVELIGWP
jgi:hypothetical protein